MKTRIERTDRGVAILGLAGEVDKNSSPEVRDALLPLVADEPKALVVDLSRVTYMDSSGVATLTEGLQLCHRCHIPFRLFGLTPAVKVVFELARLEQMFDIFETREEALSGLG